MSDYEKIYDAAEMRGGKGFSVEGHQAGIAAVVAEAKAEADRWRGAALMGLAGESRERDRAEVVENCLAVVLLHVRLARYVAAKGFVVTVLDRALAVGVASEERGPK